MSKIWDAVQFYNGYPRDSCPHCGSPQIARKGKGRDGLQRYESESAPVPLTL